MPINLANFIRTSLRAPVGPTDTVLQLALGTGAFFNFPAGDYCYITLEDRLNQEIVRFTAGGVIAGDNISVQRAQDGTLARAFPAGTCVKVSWNEQQVKDLIAEMFSALISNNCPPTNTIIVNQTPIGAPPSCVYYAVNRATDPWRAYFWDGVGWNLLGDGDGDGNTVNAAQVQALINASLALSGFLKLDGSTPMTAALTLAGSATQPQHALSLAQAQALINASLASLALSGFLKLDGSTPMTAALTLAGSATQPQHALSLAQAQALFAPISGGGGGGGDGGAGDDNDGGPN